MIRVHTISFLLKLLFAREKIAFGMIKLPADSTFVPLAEPRVLKRKVDDVSVMRHFVSVIRKIRSFGHP